MNKLLKDRVKLIRAMYFSAESHNYNDYYHIFTGINKIKENELNDFLSISQDDYRKISYAKLPEHKYDNKHRIKTTLGKYIRNNLNISKEEFSDNDLFVFCNDVIRSCTPLSAIENQIIFLSGGQISSYYENNNDKCHSCMTGEESYKTELYALNPDKVKLLIFGDIRGLLWTTDDGTIVLDRLYPSTHGDIPLIKKWAINKGYVYRLHIDTADYDSKTELSTDKQYFITLHVNECMPYLDTFKFGKVLNDEVILSNKQDGCDLIFTSVEGGINPCSVYCKYCNSLILKLNAKRMPNQYFCNDCFEQHYCECWNCADYILKENAIELANHKHVCESCIKNGYFVKCTDCNEYYDKYDLALLCVSGKYIQVCPKCSCNYYLCCECDFSYHKDALTLIDNQSFCENDLRKYYKYCVECNSYRKIDSFSLNENICNACVITKQNFISNSSVEIYEKEMVNE